ncbi:MAG: hypothetical protein BSOLF_1825 [Candidatus Carbobacillus altaicus]|uniref:Uncharacterized protein n=1 Tax=Candidatus Carbonibacillus altaicus TaxID=2163959 RepID=A0A2R6Y3L3_9BACL|nr:MAG: hypothetical protein BSOLF_1825 [Candidatus Carbobacillus altaicus]
MLDHLLIAQRKGRTAQDVFGDDPESYCKELIRTLDRQPQLVFKGMFRHVDIF